MKLKLFALTVFAAAAAMAQLNPRIPLGVTPGISQEWIAAGVQPLSGGLAGLPGLGSYTPPVYTQPLTGWSNRIGNSTYYNFSDGTSGYSNRIGNTTWYNFNNGVSGYSNPIGNTTWYNFWK